MKLAGALLVVRDMDASRRFYTGVLRRDVFLDLETYVVFEGFSIITEPQWREFQDRADLEYRYRNNVCQLGFEVGDFDEFLAHFNFFPGIEIMGAPREYPWGQRSFRFYDPDGHVIEVGEDMKVVTKRCLRSGMTVEEACEKVMYPRPFVEECLRELKGE